MSEKDKGSSAHAAIKATVCLGFLAACVYALHQDWSTAAIVFGFISIFVLAD